MTLLEDARRSGAITGTRLALIVIDRLAAVGDEPPCDELVAMTERLARSPEPSVRRAIGCFREREGLSAEAGRLRARLERLLAEA